jgi:hypothetical protein
MRTKVVRIAARGGKKGARPVSEDLDKMLIDRFAQPAWALFFEFPDGTGGNRNRSADAVAFSLFPSQGLEIYGFEKKVSRSDWLRELKNSKKADAVGKYCDRWWVVAPKDVVDVKEMPAPWGLMVPRKGRLVVLKQASKLPSKPINRAFLMSLMRQIHTRWLPRSQSDVIIGKSLQDRYDAGFRAGKAEVTGATQVPILESQLKYSKMETERLKKDISDFEMKSGLQFRSYDMGRTGEAVAVVRRLGLKNSDLADMLRAISRHIDSAKHEIADSLASIRKTLPLFEGEPKEG